MSKYKDPHKEREAKKYGRPIPSRELMLEVMEKNDGPISFRELADKLNLSDPEDLDPMKYRLRAMERDGQILFNRSKKYVPVT
ncbi:MAG: winged-helix domain-containing protein, partial [Cocleimonas sp.]